MGKLAEEANGDCSPNHAPGLGLHWSGGKEYLSRVCTRCASGIHSPFTWPSATTFPFSPSKFILLTVHHPRTDVKVKHRLVCSPFPALHSPETGVPPFLLDPRLKVLKGSLQCQHSPWDPACLLQHPAPHVPVSGPPICHRGLEKTGHTLDSFSGGGRQPFCSLSSPASSPAPSPAPSSSTFSSSRLGMDQ